MNTHEFIDQMNALNTAKVQYVQMLLKELFMKHLTTTCVEQTALSAALKKTLLQDLQRIYPAAKEQKVNGRSLVEWTKQLTANRGQPVGLKRSDENELQDLEKEYNSGKLAQKRKPRYYELLRLKEEEEDGGTKEPEEYLSMPKNGEKKAQRDDDTDFYKTLFRFILAGLGSGGGASILTLLTNCVATGNTDCSKYLLWIKGKICSDQDILEITRKFFNDPSKSTAPKPPAIFIQEKLETLHKKLRKILKLEEPDDHTFEYNLISLTKRYKKVQKDNDVLKWVEDTIKEAAGFKHQPDSKQSVSIVTKMLADARKAVDAIFPGVSQEEQEKLLEQVPDKYKRNKDMIIKLINAVDDKWEWKEENVGKGVQNAIQSYEINKQQIEKIELNLQKIGLNIENLKYPDQVKEILGVPPAQRSVTVLLDQIMAEYSTQYGLKTKQNLGAKETTKTDSLYTQAQQVLKYMTDHRETNSAI